MNCSLIVQLQMDMFQEWLAVANFSISESLYFSDVDWLLFTDDSREKDHDFVVSFFNRIIIISDISIIKIANCYPNVFFLIGSL